MAQSQVVLWNPERWIPTSHPSGQAFFSNYSTGPRNDDLDAKIENALK
jgi:hypothetical protein